MDKLKEFLKNFLKGNKKIHLLLITGIIGILLIAFSEVVAKKSSAAETVSKIDDTVYCRELEDKIKELVSQQIPFFIRFFRKEASASP